MGSLILLVAMMGAIILTLPFITNDYKKKNDHVYVFWCTNIIQINLQDSATYGMEMIIQLHNYVMFLMYL